MTFGQCNELQRLGLNFRPSFALRSSLRGSLIRGGSFFLPYRPLNAEAGLLSETQSFVVDGLVFGLFV